MATNEDRLLVEHLCELATMLAARLALKGAYSDINAADTALFNNILIVTDCAIFGKRAEKMIEDIRAIADRTPGKAEAWRDPPQIGTRR